MPDGDKEPNVVERVFQLSEEGSTVDQIVELVNEEMAGSDEALRWDASTVSRLLRLHRLSAGGTFGAGNGNETGDCGLRSGEHIWPGRRRFARGTGSCVRRVGGVAGVPGPRSGRLPGRRVWRWR